MGTSSPLGVGSTAGGCKGSPWTCGVRADPSLEANSGENRMQRSRLWGLEQVCLGRGTVDGAQQVCTNQEATFEPSLKPNRQPGGKQDAGR